MNSEWSRYIDETSGYPYFLNNRTGESRWATEQEASERRPEHHQNGDVHGQFTNSRRLQQQHSVGNQQGYRDDANDESEGDEDEYSDDEDEDEEEDEDKDDDEDDDDDEDEDEDEDESEDGESDGDDIEASSNVEKGSGSNAEGYPFGHHAKTPSAGQNRSEQTLTTQQNNERRIAGRNAKYDPSKKKGKTNKRTFAMAAVAVFATATSLFSSIGSMFASPKKKKRGIKGSGQDGVGKKRLMDLEGGANGADVETRPAASARPSTSSAGDDRRPTRTTNSAAVSAPQGWGHGQGPLQGPPNGPPNRYRHEVVGDTPRAADEEEGDDDDSSDEDGSGSSVSSDDSDANANSAPLLPEWVSWKGLTTNVRSFFTPAAADPPIDGEPPAMTAPRLLEMVSTTSVEVAKKIGKPIVETIQWSLKQTGAGVAVVAGSIWVRLNAALQQYVDNTIDNNGNNARRDRELAIAPSTTRDALAP